MRCTVERPTRIGSPKERTSGVPGFYTAARLGDAIEDRDAEAN
jgi:hypothetical protein